MIRADVSVYTPDGRLVGRRQAQLLTHVIIKFLAAGMLDINVPNVNDTSNTPRTITIKTTSSCGQMCVMAGPGEDTAGIVVGTGTAAPTTTDYNLQSPIRHGTAAGQLSYGGTTFDGPTDGPTEHYFNIIRSFTAVSSDVQVNEIGLIGKIFDTSATRYNFLLDRTLLQFIVPQGQTRTVVYTIALPRT